MKFVRSATLCRRSWLYVLVWLSLSVGSQGVVLAKEPKPRVALPWLRIGGQADSCVPEHDLVREVERILAEKPRDGVRVEASARGRGWVVEMWHAAGQYAVREFPVLPEECELRLSALALSIALAVEHAVASTRSPDFASDELALSAPSVPAPAWALALHAGASIGELPNVAALLGVDGRIERGPWVPLELRAFADVWTPEVSFAGARLATRQLTGALSSCLGPGKTGAWRFDVCLGIELGATLGRVQGVPQPERAVAGSGALSLGLTTRWSPRRHLAFTARFEGFGRFWTPNFVLLEADGTLFEEYRLPPAGGRLWFGVAWLSK
jgi:hypothetical protein